MCAEAHRQHIELLKGGALVETEQMSHRRKERPDHGGPEPAGPLPWAVMYRKWEKERHCGAGGLDKLPALWG